MRQGNTIHFLNPKPGEIKIHDIAWHLARTCRFNAAMNVWYSNAEHSILGSRLAPSVKEAREFLLHDAAEYVFGDIASPVKKLLPDYNKLINEFENKIYLFFLGYIPDGKAIKVIDSRICATEMKYLRNNEAECLESVPYDNLHFYCWTPEKAFIKYMESFQWLFPEYKGE
jgi:hypothetical protein